MAKAIDLAPERSELIEPARYNIAYFLNRTPTLQTAFAIDYTPYALAFHPDGNRLFTSGNGGQLRSWDPWTGTPLGSAVQLDANIERLAISPDGNTLYCAGTKGAVYRFDARSPSLQKLEPWEGHEGAVLAIAVSPDGKHVATGGEDGQLIVRDASTGKEVVRLAPHGRIRGLAARASHAIRAIAFGPGGTNLATAGWDGTIRVTDWKRSKEIAALRGGNGFQLFWAVCYVQIEDKTFIAGADFAGVVYLWNERQEVMELARRAGPITALAPQPGRSKGELAFGGGPSPKKGAMRNCAG